MDRSVFVCEKKLYEGTETVQDTLPDVSQGQRCLTRLKGIETSE
jgi:hypothetical protein